MPHPYLLSNINPNSVQNQQMAQMIPSPVNNNNHRSHNRSGVEQQDPRISTSISSPKKKRTIKLPGGTSSVPTSQTR